MPSRAYSGKTGSRRVAHIVNQSVISCNFKGYAGGGGVGLLGACSFTGSPSGVHQGITRALRWSSYSATADPDLHYIPEPRQAQPRLGRFGVRLPDVHHEVVHVDVPHGAIQATGSADHQNEMRLMIELAILPLVAAVLEDFGRRRILYLGIAAYLIVIAGEGSRATLGFVGAGIPLLLQLSYLRRPSPHKIKITGAAAWAIGLAIPLALGRLASAPTTNPS